VIETDRLIAPDRASPQEEAIERALRPKHLQEYVGQEKIRSQLSIFIEAARNRRESLDHVLLFGPVSTLNTGEKDNEFTRKTLDAI